MAVVDAFNLPKTSPFKDPAQIPLPNNPPIQVSIEKQSIEEGDRGMREDSPSMRELAEQIDSHIVVVD